jgi:hypothetical protein
MGISFSFSSERLIDYLLFYVPLKNFSLIWKRHRCRQRAAKFRPMFGAYGLYRATSAVTWDLGFSGLIRRTAPFSRLVGHTRGCGRPILTRILTGAHPKDRGGLLQSPLTTHKGMWRIYSNLDPLKSSEIIIPVIKIQYNNLQHYFIVAVGIRFRSIWFRYRLREHTFL